MMNVRRRRGARVSVWPPLPPTVHLQRRSSPPFPLDRPDCRLFARARHGLWHGLRALGLRQGDAVLVPAYHHGSEIEAVRSAGMECIFYDLADDLSPDFDRLEPLLAPNVRALHLTHYFGFPQDAPRWRQWCDERGLLLVEDAAQAWLAQRHGVPVGSHGDLAVFCLYKTVGMPDGAAVLCRSPIAVRFGQRRAGTLGLARRHLAWAAQRGGWKLEGGARAVYDSAADFALGNPRTLPSFATSAVLPRLDSSGVAEARRVRYEVLRDALRSLVPPPFDTVPDESSPFLFPVCTSAKQELLTTLRAAGVHALDVWAVPHPSMNESRYPVAQRMRRQLVGLPVHQELRPHHLQHIIDAVDAAVR